MTRDEVAAWAVRHGYTKDRFGHYQKVGDKGIKVRLVLSKILARLEHQVSICGKNEWVRNRSGYFSKLSLSDKDALRGMETRF